MHTKYVPYIFVMRDNTKGVFLCVYVYVLQSMRGMEVDYVDIQKEFIKGPPKGGATCREVLFMDAMQPRQLHTRLLHTLFADQRWTPVATSERRRSSDLALRMIT